jgi:ATP-dependent helicase Lhr and Lhr-like helicase
LINDQCRRLEPLGEALGLPVTPWHGDVPQALKRRLRDRPAGILLITPESVEAMLARRGSSVAAFFGEHDYVVVDELHSFIATERGRQLQSLLHRVELVIGRSVPRVGLSATLGDLEQAARFLRPDGAVPDMVESTVARRNVKLQLRGYRDADAADDHLYGVVAHGTHIVFANQRAEVEVRVQALKRRAEGSGRAGDGFWAHHGSLAKELREDAATALRAERDATVVATTTLELGIDVGSVDTIVQLGTPPSASSMRQRLGRSGRRDGDASILRIYAEEQAITVRTPPQDQLRETVAQSAAMVQLLVEGYNETPTPGALHLSTLVQQVLSLVAQRGGIRADDGWRSLCATGPFREAGTAQFAMLFRDLADHDLLMQTHDGTILLGLEGELSSTTMTSTQRSSPPTSVAWSPGPRHSAPCLSRSATSCCSRDDAGARSTSAIASASSSSSRRPAGRHLRSAAAARRSMMSSVRACASCMRTTTCRPSSMEGRESC